MTSTPPSHIAESTAPEDVALVHDYLNQRGGAERVVLELAKIWPQAPIYTSLYRSESTFRDFAAHDIRASFMDRLPVDAGFRVLAPLYPAAFRSLGCLTQPLVISSSSGWAHGVMTSQQTCHIVYCHAPARWLYAPERYLGRSLVGRAFRIINRPLRRWDQRAARRPDHYIANSRNIQQRIRSIYGIDAPVVYPPVDTARFTPLPRGDRLLVVSRLLPYKRIDLAVAAATRARIELDVVGAGPCLAELQDLAGPTVSFHGAVQDEVVTEMLQSCRAVIVPGTEDFGMLPVEANAAGKPVVAFAAGGALETVKDGVTGVLFRDQSTTSLLEALQTVDRLDTSPETLAAQVERFSPQAFRHAMLATIDRCSSETAI